MGTGAAVEAKGSDWTAFVGAVGFELAWLTCFAAGFADDAAAGLTGIAAGREAKRKKEKKGGVNDLKSLLTREKSLACLLGREESSTQRSDHQVDSLGS